MKISIPFETFVQSGLCTKHGEEISIESLSAIFGVRVSYMKEILSDYSLYLSDKKIPANIAYFISETLFGEDRSKELRPKIKDKISQYKEWLKKEKCNLNELFTN